MRHHGQVPAIGRAECSNACRRAIGVEGVRLCVPAMVIHVPQGHKPFPLNAPLQRWVWELKPALAMCRPSAKDAALHAREPHALALLHPQVHKARFEPRRVVVRQARCGLFGHGTRAKGHPLEAVLELATVTDPEREGVVTLVELLQLRCHGGLEPGRRRPALGRAQRVGIGEAAHEGRTAELLEPDGAPCQVRHGHVPGLEAGQPEGRCHLPITVAALLADDRHLRRFARQLPLRRGARDGRVDEGRAARGHAPLLLLDACGIGLQHLKGK
mmetsp:Transcript_44429/g.123540  ORF Transcript_44429/g.123540 Transcript_44429/m.123540 type:complete len:272 (-) Transcript_44429:1189-2004(-)